jgi:hypothetical protein
MTLAEQLTALKLKHGDTEQIDPAILLRVLDSIVERLAAQHAHIDEFGQTVGHVLTKLDAKADKVPYSSSR